MLAKSSRLNLSKNFTWVVKGKKLETDSLKIFYRFDMDQSSAKIGVALTKSTFKNSVLRNQVKRRIYKVIMLIYPNLSNKVNLVIMPKKDITKVSLGSLEKEIKSVSEVFNFGN